MRKLFIIFLISVLWSITSTNQTFPKYIQRCHYGHLKCIKDSMNSVIKRFSKGIPEIGLQRLDIVTMKDYQFWNHAVVQNVRLNYKLYNQAIYGFENTTITDVQGFGREPEIKHLEIHGIIPSLVHKSNFKANGRVYVININSTGKSTSDFQNFRFSVKFKNIMEYRNNTRYLKFYDSTPTFTISRWIVQLDGLFKENTDLTIAVNRLFNDNWLVFWNSMEARIVNIFKRVTLNIVKKIFDAVPYDQLFLKDSVETI